MRKFPILILLMFVFIGGYAQQEAQYTQFMYNKLALNPAYAGSSEVPCFSCIHRSQWVGFEGAPTSQVLNFHIPFFKNRVGIGASISHDKIGPTNSWDAKLMYAYRIPVGSGNLGIGLQGSLKGYQVRFDETSATHSGDDGIPTASTTRILPNFGAGLYYNTPKFYMGLSMPTILKGDLSYDEYSSDADFGVEQTHIYLMAGYLFEISDVVKFKPAFLAKSTANAPFDLDVNGTFIFLDKFWTGLSYRLGGNLGNSFGESIDLTFQYQISKSIRAGLAYDFSLTKIRAYNSGTFEIFLEYCMKYNDNRLTNPRFF